MSYFLVLNFDIEDAVRFKQYQERTRAMASRPLGESGLPPMKVVAFDTQPKDLEGHSRERLVILEFESEDAAMRWYNSPEYAAAKPFRQESTIGWVRGVPGPQGD